MLERDIDQSFPPLVTAIGNGQHTKSGHLYLTLLTAYALACIACWQGSHHTVPSATRISVAPPACQNIRVFVRIRSALLKPTAEEREIVVLKHLSITTATKDKRCAAIGRASANLDHESRKYVVQVSRPAVCRDWRRAFPSLQRSALYLNAVNATTTRLTSKRAQQYIGKTFENFSR